MKKMWNNRFFIVWMASFYLFLYLPFILLFIFSFNSDPFVFHWRGFTTRWYEMLFNLVEVRQAFYNSVLIAVTSSLMSLCMGTLFVSYAMQYVVGRLQPLFYAILVIPEIIVAVGILGFCTYVGISLGFISLIIGHTLLGLGYVVPMVYDRFIELDKRLVEAAYDLGATHFQVVRTVIIPLLRPVLLSSGLLVFIVSFDDFVISFFCAGGACQTLPMYIFMIIKSGASPVVAALGMMLLMVSCVAVFIFSFLHVRNREVAQ